MVHAPALEARELPVVALPSFIDDARGMLTEVQIGAVKRQVLRELGKVVHEHCGTLRVREVPFAGFQVLVYDYWSLGEIQLVGLKPITDGDDPHSPTGKARTAIRRVLRKAGTILGYEAAKRLLRDLLGYGRPSSVIVGFRENGEIKVLTSRQGNEKLEKMFGRRTFDEPRDNFLVVAKFDVVETWYLHANKQDRRKSYGLERGNFAFDYLVEQQTIIGDLPNERCFLPIQRLRDLRLSMDISNQRQ